MGDETPKKKKNWKTTVGGFGAGILLIVAEACDLLGVAMDPITNGKFEPAFLIAGLGAIGIGWFARDKNVSSEDSGAK